MHVRLYENVQTLFFLHTFLLSNFAAKCLCLNSDVSMYMGSHLFSSLCLTYFCASLIIGEGGRFGILAPCSVPSVVKILFTNKNVKWLKESHYSTRNCCSLVAGLCGPKKYC